MLEVLAQQKAIIVGEPGCGKTTLLRHIVRRISKGELLRERTPLIIPLASLVVGLGCIEAWVKIAHSGVAEFLLKALEGGNAVLLLDGLDELSRAHHALLVDELKRLASFGNQVFITCRTVSLPRGLFPSDFRQFECIGFSVAQQRRFLSQWFASLPERASSLEQQINAHRGVLGFARNPLLLSLMAVVAENEPSFMLPVARTALYEKSISALLHRRRTSSQAKLTPGVKLRLLKRLAVDNFLDSREVLSEAELLLQIENFFSGSRSSIESDDVIHELVEVDGILVRQGVGHYRFLHLTFQEYLTAVAVVETGRYTAIFEQMLLVPRWEEVIRLVCGLLPRDVAAQQIGMIWGGAENKAILARLLLAARAASDCPALPNVMLQQLAHALVTARSGRQRPNQAFEVDEALAALCRTHEGLMEEVVSFGSSLSPNPKVEQPMSLPTVVRLFGLCGDRFSGQNLRAIWDQFASAPISDTVLSTMGSVIEATAQAGFPATHIVKMLSSPSCYLRSAAARALIDLQPVGAKSELKLNMEAAVNSDQLNLTMAVLGSFQDSRLVEQVFEYAFRRDDPTLQNCFVFHYNRGETELDLNLFRDTLDAAADDSKRARLLSMHRCFLDPSLFSRLQQIASSGDTFGASRAAAVATLVKLDSESTIPLLRAVTVTGAWKESLRAILSVTTAQSAEAVGRVLLSDLAVDRRTALSSEILRFAMRHRVSVLVDWIESLLVNPDIPAAVFRHSLLALAALGSPAFLQYANQFLAERNPSDPSGRILAYRGLGLLQTTAARTLLMQWLDGERDRAAAAEAIRALGQYGDPDSVLTLIRLLDLQNWPIGWPAPEGPRRQGDQRPSDLRRLTVIVALDRLGAAAALPELLRLADDPQEGDEVRDAAMVASQNIMWGQDA
ncbi:HEAT repeat domain-containing protein [Mesorhizobium sp. IMUNJ 23033]|uniref:HEAT repeat domain-containing protein n=1 Tax=Mesorhizobium sp. IMUNJ 23033 TaxID=3378039 RepID=UPI00384FAA3D